MGYPSDARVEFERRWNGWVGWSSLLLAGVVRGAPLVKSSGSFQTTVFRSASTAASLVGATIPLLNLLMYAASAFSSTREDPPLAPPHYDYTTNSLHALGSLSAVGAAVFGALWKARNPFILITGVLVGINAIQQDVRFEQEINWRPLLTNFVAAGVLGLPLRKII